MGTEEKARLVCLEGRWNEVFQRRMRSVKAKGWQNPAELGSKSRSPLLANARPRRGQ